MPEPLPPRFTGRVALITGAGRNIGAAVAGRIAAEGGRVAVVDIDPGRAHDLADAIGAAHARAYAADVSSAAAVEAVVRCVQTDLGGLDVLVNNVAVTDRKTVLEVTEREWDEVVAVTLKATFLCSRAAARAMVSAGTGGTIINVASTSGYRGRANSTAYPAAKAAVLNLTKSLAVQLAPHRIRVNSVTPNQIGSPVGEDAVRAEGSVRNLVGRNGVPTDIAAAVAYLASDDAEFVTGADLLVDGGAMAGF